MCRAARPLPAVPSSQHPAAPGSARQRPRGQCGAGGGLRGGDCLRLAREAKVGHGRPAERDGGGGAVAGEWRRAVSAPPAAPGVPSASPRMAAAPAGLAGPLVAGGSGAPLFLRAAAPGGRRGSAGSPAATPATARRRRSAWAGSRSAPPAVCCCGVATCPVRAGAAPRGAGGGALVRGGRPDRGAAPGLAGLWVQETAPEGGVLLGECRKGKAFWAKGRKGLAPGPRPLRRGDAQKNLVGFAGCCILS